MCVYTFCVPWVYFYMTLATRQSRTDRFNIRANTQFTVTLVRLVITTTKLCIRPTKHNLTNNI